MAQGVLVMRTHVVSVLVPGVAVVMFGCGLAVAQQAPAAGADKWYSVATSDSEVAYVNTNSIKQVGTTIEVKVKENFTAPRPAAKAGKTFLSTRTLYRVDCASRKIAMSKNEAFSGADLQGDVVQKA
jgi:Surface-adhesin protein E